MKPHSSLCAFAAAALTLSFVGCASIVNGGPKTVHINSNPPGALISIFDKDGKPVAVNANVTPAVVKLKRAHGAFTGEDYRIVFEKKGYLTAQTHVLSAINGWYWGNFGFGGIIGFLVVDPLTGSMFTLEPETVDQNLTPAGGSSAGSPRIAKARRK